MPFVERLILCPYLGESPIRGSTVHTYVADLPFVAEDYSTYKHAYTHSMYVRSKCACMYVRTHTHMHTRTRTHAHAHTHTHTHTHTHIHTHTHTLTHTHSHTHTHTHTPLVCIICKDDQLILRWSVPHVVHGLLNIAHIHPVANGLNVYYQIRDVLSRR